MTDPLAPPRITSLKRFKHCVAFLSWPTTA
jgi:hypothetical protein